MKRNKVRWDRDFQWWEVVSGKEWQGEWWRAEQVDKIIGFICFNGCCDMYCVRYGNDYHMREYFVKFADARAFAQSL